MSGWRLVSDVGGTNVRFARVFGSSLSDFSCYPVSRFSSFPAALATYLDTIGGTGGCESAAIGAAGAVVAGNVSLTNVSWRISKNEIAAVLGVPCVIINDVQAVAFSLPTLAADDIVLLGTCAPDLANAERLLVANIGTGFGAAALIRHSAGWVSCPSEAGHMSLRDRGRWDEKSGLPTETVEHVLSGRGLCNLYTTISSSPCEPDPSKLISNADTDRESSAALRLFTEIAGDVLGNLTLAVAAWDGVYLCGSVARAFAQAADLSLLRKRFNNKGPMTERMKKIPIVLIKREDAALSGLAALSMPT